MKIVVPHNVGRTLQIVTRYTYASQYILLYVYGWRPSVGVLFSNFFQIFHYFQIYPDIFFAIKSIFFRYRYSIFVYFTIAYMLYTTIAISIFAIKSFFSVVFLNICIFYDSYTNDYIYNHSYSYL